MTELSASGAILSGSSGFIGGSLDFPEAVAIDTSGSAWVANFGGASVRKFFPAGSVMSPTRGFIGGGLDAPAGVAIDGAGNVWVTNYHGMSVTELAGVAASSPGAPLSGASGYTDSSLREPFGIAIDSLGQCLGCQKRRRNRGHRDRVDWRRCTGQGATDWAGR